MLENCEATVECFLNDFDLVTVESNDFLTVGAFSSSFEPTKLGKSVAALFGGSPTGIGGGGGGRESGTAAEGIGGGGGGATGLLPD